MEMARARATTGAPSLASRMPWRVAEFQRMTALLGEGSLAPTVVARSKAEQYARRNLPLK
jgi:hypothetical protein